MHIAITREVSPSLGDCELTHLTRTPIDIDKACAQHSAYQRTLASLGCRVLTLEAEPAMPDAVFVEDVAVVLDEVAVMTRPGASSRRAEGASIAELLRRYRHCARLKYPGTLDGGDVLRVGRTLYVGESGRSNAEGIAQLANAIAEFGYRVQAVPIRDCLHLKVRGYRGARRYVVDATGLGRCIVVPRIAPSSKSTRQRNMPPTSCALATAW